MSALGRVRRSTKVRAVGTAVLAPAVATGLGLILQPGRALGAISIYLLGVVVAAAVGGLWSGLVASVLSLLCINYFFTEPLHTLRVTDSEDAVALVAFLVVAAIVGSLVARTLEEKARAARGERESRLLSYLATKVLSGERLERVLEDFAGSLLGPLHLARCEIRARTRAGSYDVVQTRDLTPPGEERRLPLDVGGEVFGTLVVVRAEGQPPIGRDDVRLLEAAARQIAIALERAGLDAQVNMARLDAETNQARAALFSAVTHDLRTPLASIKAAVTSLLKDEAAHDDAQRRDLLQTVLEETDRLNRLLGNLLDLARFEAGALTPAKQPVAMDEILESVLHRLQSRLSRFRIRTVIRDTPEIAADPVQLDQVFTNLLENAARFSPPGGEIAIVISPWKRAVQVRISDQGPGISSEERDRVFDAFYQGDDGGHPGSGLGLTIARAIVLAHGGRIRIEGSPTGGVSVVFELPALERSVGAANPGAAELSVSEPGRPAAEPGRSVEAARGATERTT
jgi:two-component system, OmpR family, sensor histidine kinase KdpD